MKYYFIYILLVIVLYGCNQYTPKEYVSYISDQNNGLYNEINLNEIQYKIQYFPVEYKVLLEVGDTKIIDFEKSKRLYQNGLYFNLKVFDSTMIESQGSASKGINYSGELYNTINFWFEPMVYLVMGSDTLRCRLSHLEPVSPNTPVFNFSLVFERTEKYFEKHRQDSLYFVFNDIIWSNEKVVAGFLVEDLMDRPSLKL